MKITALIIHHSASGLKTTLKQINDWHKAREFPKSFLGFFCGYHYVIGDGWIKQTRKIKPVEIGSHCRDKGMNFHSIGICLVGNFVKDKPTVYQKRELGKLLVGLRAEFKLGEEAIKIHKDFSQTECPGFLSKKDIFSWMKNWKKL